MMLPWLAWTLTLTGIFLLVLGRNWRRNLGGLALQYLGAFWLIQPNWSLVVASVSLISGWMAGVVLGLNLRLIPPSHLLEKTWPGSRLFRLLEVVLILLVTFVPALRLSSWLDTNLPTAWGGLLLIGAGLLILGTHQQAWHVILGLLSTLTGFQVLYAAVESSVLVAALLVIVHLGMALVGAYLLEAGGTS